VSVGYSIGFGVLHEKLEDNMIFSTFFNMVGIVINCGFLALMIRWLTSAKKDWRLNALHSLSEKPSVEIRANIFDESFLETLKKLLHSIYNWVLRMIRNADSYMLVFIVYVIFGISWSCG